MNLQVQDTRILEKSGLLYDLLLSACLSLGCWGCLFTMFGSPLSYVLSLFLVILLPPAFLLLCHINFVGKYMAFYVLLLSAAFLLIFYSEAMDGCLQMINFALERLNEQLGTGYIDFATTGKASNIAYAFFPAVLVLSAVIGQGIANRKVLATFLFTAVTVMIGLFFSGTPSMVMLILLTMAWAALFLSASGTGRFPVIGLSLVLLLLFSLAFTSSDWKPIHSITAVKDRFIQWEEGIRYGGNEIDGLSQGDLTKTHPLNYDDQSVFSLQMQLGQSIYLRGFTGANYDQQSQKWVETEDTAYSGDFRGINQWLSGHDYNTWCMENNLYRLKVDSTYTEIEVENRRASSKYMWLPYETAVTGDADEDQTSYDQDRTPRANGLKGKRNYTIKIFDSSLKEYNDTLGSRMLRVMARQPGYEDYLKKEAVYRTFAYRNYTSVDKNSKRLLQDLNVEKCKGKNLDYCLYVLRDQFDKKFKYSTDTKAAPEGKDNLAYFLQESKKGNCMHFATTAALFLREAGFPTRYAEGYYLSPKQLELYEKLENVKMPIADSDCHAWVEVYIDKIGWMPVEVTPGFYDVEKQQSPEKEDSEDLSSTQEDSYTEDLPVDNNSLQSIIKKHLALWKIILPAILLLMVLYLVIRKIVAGRYKDMRSAYRYLCRLFAIAGIKIKRDPYDAMEEIKERFDPYTEESSLTYEKAIRLIYRERFGNLPLDRDELILLNQYCFDVSCVVYAQSPWYKSLLMKLIALAY